MVCINRDYVTSRGVTTTSAQGPLYTLIQLPPNASGEQIEAVLSGIYGVPVTQVEPDMSDPHASGIRPAVDPETAAAYVSRQQRAEERRSLFVAWICTAFACGVLVGLVINAIS